MTKDEFVERLASELWAAAHMDHAAGFDGDPARATFVRRARAFLAECGWWNKEERFECRDCGIGVSADEDGICTYCGRDCRVRSGVHVFVLKGGEADSSRTVRESARLRPGAAGTQKARYCDRGGCRDSWWVGGNYGSPVCRNPEHYKGSAEEAQESRPNVGSDPARSTRRTVEPEKASREAATHTTKAPEPAGPDLAPEPERITLWRHGDDFGWIELRSGVPQGGQTLVVVPAEAYEFVERLAQRR